MGVNTSMTSVIKVMLDKAVYMEVPVHITQVFVHIYIIIHPQAMLLPLFLAIFV